MRIYTDTEAEVHEGDTVRYVRWDYATHGKFYRKTGTVTDIGPERPGSAGVHFPHYARGMTILAVADELRLVACPHGKEERR